MAVQYFPENYICPKCQLQQKHYTWSDEIETKTHTCVNDQCKSDITSNNLHIEVKEPVFTVKMTTSQIKSERKNRATEHFKKEIVPTMNPKSDEGRYFRQKYDIKK